MLLELLLVVLAQVLVQLQGIDIPSLRTINAASICHEMIPLNGMILDHDKKLNNAPTYGASILESRLIPRAAIIMFLV